MKISKKINLIVSIFIMTISLLGCDSNQEKELKNFAVLEVGNLEHVISRKDSDRLRELLAASSGWEECDACDCIGAYKVALDGVQYMVDRMDENHPIHFSKPDVSTNKAMENEDKNVVKEVYKIIEKWGSLGDSYEYFLMEHQTPSASAVLTINTDGSDIEYIIEKEDTKQLRKLLAADAGWIEDIGCECIGEHEITIDNIRYVIDITGETHEIKYGMAGKSAEYAIYGSSANMQEIFRIIEKTLP